MPISDNLTLKTCDADSRSDEDTTIQWKEIISCKIRKLPRWLVVKDTHGKKLVIGTEFPDHLKIWKLITDRAI